MTDKEAQELNEQVAKKLGWVQCCNPMTMENGKIIDCFGWSKDGSHFHEGYPNYCRDIKAAWEIMEKERYTLFTLLPKEYNKHMMQTWVCNAGGAIYCAETAPEAIVKAFLELP